MAERLWDSLFLLLLPRQWTKEETDEAAEKSHKKPLEEKIINSQQGDAYSRFNMSGEKIGP